MTEQLIVPAKKMIYRTVIDFGKTDSSEIDRLREENSKLISELVKEQETERENQALQDQFETTNLSPQKLLPVSVVGMVGFLPGISSPDELIIDKGSSDGIKIGYAVVYKDNIVGKISMVSSHTALILPPTNKNFFLTAQTAKTSALGILQGQGGNVMILGNVVLSDTLENGDYVVTKDDIDKNGTGFPEGLLFGKIVSVSKQASSLFQAAKVESLIDFSKLEMVFVMVENK